MDAVARLDAYRDLAPGWVYDKPSDGEFRALARAAREKGCDDPLVSSICLGILDLPPRKPETIESSLRLLEGLRQYPPVHAANLAVKILPFSGGKRKKVMDVLFDQLAAASCAEEYPGIDRRFVLKSIHDDLLPLAGGVQKLALQLADRDNADPWIAGSLMGEVELCLGVAADDPDRFPSLVPQKRKDPAPHWQAAEKLLLRAWKLHRDYPEPAVLMMSLAGVSESPENLVRLWFRRAAAAQFDWKPAYTEMASRLINRGDTEGLYAFGLECLKTGRYDSDVPWRFLIYLNEIRRLMGGEAFWRRPEVYVKVREFFRGNAREPQHKDMSFDRSVEAMFAYCTDHFQEARAALDKAGDRLDRDMFKGQTPDPTTSIARIYALTGSQAAKPRLTKAT